MGMLGSLSEPYIRLHEVARYLHWATRKARVEFDQVDGLIKVPAGKFAPWIFIPVPAVVAKLRSMNYPEVDIKAFVEDNQRNRNGEAVKPPATSQPKAKVRKPSKVKKMAAASQAGQRAVRRKAS